MGNDLCIGLVLTGAALALLTIAVSGCEALQSEWQRGEDANVDWNYGYAGDGYGWSYPTVPMWPPPFNN